MNAYLSAETLTRTQPLEDHRAGPSVDPVPQKARFEDQSRARHSAEAAAPDEGGFDIFIEGAGI